MNKFKEWLKNKAANSLDEGPYLSGAVLNPPVRKKPRSKPKLRHEPESSQNPIPLERQPHWLRLKEVSSDVQAGKDSMSSFASRLDHLSKKYNVKILSLDINELEMGMTAEKEHTLGDTAVAHNLGDVLKICVAHLREDPKYYTKLKQAGL